MKLLLVTFEVPFPDEATKADADAVVKHMTMLAVSPSPIAEFEDSSAPVRPYGKLDSWTFED